MGVQHMQNKYSATPLQEPKKKKINQIPDTGFDKMEKGEALCDEERIAFQEEIQRLKNENAIFRGKGEPTLLERVGHEDKLAAHVRVHQSARAEAETAQLSMLEEDERREQNNAKYAKRKIGKKKHDPNPSPYKYDISNLRT